jgi:hypothetical protein
LYATDGTKPEEREFTVMIECIFKPGWVWYPVEFDLKSNIVFGYVTGGDSYPEWGYQDLSELRGSYGVTIEPMTFDQICA